ncbi:MAG: pitrilysin family protein [Candidatus Omnitrophota bacterium]
MTKKIFLIVACVILCLSSTAFCATLPGLSNPPVVEKKFENGLTCLVEEHPQSGLAALNIIFKSGSANEDEYLGYGISHLIEHLMIRSSQKYPIEGETQKILKTLGATFNASTSADTVSIYLTVPKTNVNQAIELILEMAFFPNFSDEAVHKEKEVVHKEIILYQDNPDARVSELLWKTAFHIHPYQHPIIGYPLLFLTITPEDVRRSYSSRFSPSSAVLSVVGDVSANDVFEIVKKNLTNVRLPNYRQPVVLAEPPQTMPRSSKEIFDTNLSRMAIGFPVPGILGADIATLDLIAIILGQGNSSRLNKKLIQDLELIQSIDVSNDTLADAGLFTITSVLKPELTAKVTNIIMDEINLLQNKQISSLELTRAQKLLLFRYLSSRSSLDAIAGSLSLEKLLTGDAKFSQKYLEAIKRVTAQQIQDIAKKYFKPKKATFSELIPKSYTQENKKQPEASFAQSLPFKTKTLDNGIKIIAIQNTLVPTASITIAFKGGLLAETESNNGISKICVQTLLRSGKTPGALTSSFENRGATISSSFDNNSFGLQANILKEDFPFALKAMAETLKNPAFPAEELTKIKDLCLLDIQTDNDNMFRHGFLDLKKALYKDHPYARRANGTKKSISSITRKDVMDFYKHFGTSANMVISFSGDINPEEAMKEIENAFSSFPRSPIIGLLTPQGIKPISAQEDLTIDLDRQGAAIFFGFNGIRLSDDDTFSFDVLASIMSGQNGRLLYSIRNKDNLTYVQNFFSSPSYDNGFFGLYAGTSPEKQDLVIKGIEEQLTLLIQNSVTDKEISDAKIELLTKYLIRKQQNNFLASQAAAYLLYDLDLAKLFDYDKYILNITKNNIKKIIDQYIKDKPFIKLLLTSVIPPE